MVSTIKSELCTDFSEGWHLIQRREILDQLVQTDFPWVICFDNSYHTGTSEITTVFPTLKSEPR